MELKACACSISVGHSTTFKTIGHVLNLFTWCFVVVSCWNASEAFAVRNWSTVAWATHCIPTLHHLLCYLGVYSTSKKARRPRFKKDSNPTFWFLGLVLKSENWWVLLCFLFPGQLWILCLLGPFRDLVPFSPPLVPASSTLALPIVVGMVDLCFSCLGYSFFAFLNGRWFSCFFRYSDSEDTSFFIWRISFLGLLTASLCFALPFVSLEWKILSLFFLSFILFYFWIDGVSILGHFSQYRHLLLLECLYFWVLIILKDKREANPFFILEKLMGLSSIPEWSNPCWCVPSGCSPLCLSRHWIFFMDA